MDKAGVERLMKKGKTGKLVKCLWDRDEYVRSAAARALERLGIAAIPGLVQSLQGAATVSRRVSASALGKCRHPLALSTLLRVSARKEKGGDPSLEVREAALRSLGNYSEPEAIAALQAASLEKLVGISRAAWEALAPKIVGESHYQPALRHLAESGAWNITGRRVTAAYLQPNQPTPMTRTRSW